jgi:hypothetical protein
MRDVHTICNDSAGTGIRLRRCMLAFHEKQLENFSLRISPFQTGLDSFHAMNVFFDGTAAATFYVYAINSNSADA